MAPSTLAYVTPAVLRWARESTGYSVSEAATKIGVRSWQLEAAEEGVDLLTLRQAEKAAAAYERPLAALYLPSPPPEEPQEAQFRRLPGAPSPPWPVEMQLLARRVRERQEAAGDLYELLEEEPLWPEVARQIVATPEASMASVVRGLLELSREEQEHWGSTPSVDLYAPLRAWVDALEGLGVLVMQDGSMPLEQMRGFASQHPTVPAVVINSTDDPRARAFSAIHELGHLILAARGQAPGPRTEQWCNEFAAEVIVPTDWLREIVERAAGLGAEEVVARVARTFSVTPLAAAIRVRRSGALPEDEVEAVVEKLRSSSRSEADRPGGGNYYRNVIGHLGPAFIRLVFAALDGQAVTYPTASSLLGNVKVNNFDTLREHLARRTDS